MDGSDKRCAVLIIDNSPKKISQLMATLQKEYGGALATCVQTVGEAALSLPEDTVLFNMILHKTNAASMCSSQKVASIDHSVAAPGRSGAEKHATCIRHELVNANHAILLGTSLLSGYWDDLVSHMESLDDEYDALLSCNEDCQEARKNGAVVIASIIESARRIEAYLAKLKDGAFDSIATSV